ncbi:MAG: hypothetical protein V2I33_19385 [Kangiellaceae bacterium]|jgi:hypothetical protein|nr:hypothetical protein [Kangiellaceae bacterium]
MRKTLSLVWVLFFSYLGYSQEAKDSIPSYNQLNKWLQLDIGYDQFRKGFFLLGTGAHFEPPEFGYVWHSHSIYYGYSPWLKKSQITYSGDVTFYAVSFGVKAIAYTNYKNENYCFRPFIGFNVVDHLRLNLGRNFLTGSFGENEIRPWVFSLTIGLKVTDRDVSAF